MKVTKVALFTNSLEAQVRFYMNVLHLPTVADSESLHIQVGSSELTFRQSTGNQTHAYHFAFNIPENRFEEAKAWIAEHIPLIANSSGEDSFDFKNWNAHSCYFRDAAGNILEFIARHGLPNASDMPFDEQGILSISEIGIASDDVIATVEQLQGAGMPIYDGAGSDTFAAVGDEHGLLIVVRHGRIWFPDTGTPADLVPLKVVVSLGSGAKAVISGPPYEVSYT
ncbi:MAG: VOC family protein [Chloroflexota bacterium]|nr:VOC family protein [Chloroflexota bacterium]MDQ5865191.1 VOC family protein [Chloroflexota bacterium]